MRNYWLRRGHGSGHGAGPFVYTIGAIYQSLDVAEKPSTTERSVRAQHAVKGIRSDALNVHPSGEIAKQVVH